jgi:hypothetical protein
VQGRTGNPENVDMDRFDGGIFSLHDEFRKKGVAIRQPPTSHRWAMEMQIEDPDGHVLRFGTDPVGEPF